MTLPLWTRISQLLDPLPADTVAGLLAVAATRQPGDELRTRMIGREDVTAAQARSLLSQPLAENELMAYVSRPGTSAAEATALLRSADPDTLTWIAQATTCADVLTWIVASSDAAKPLLHVARNARTPTAVAVAAVTRILERRARSEHGAAQSYTWMIELPLHVCAAWAPTSTDLAALTAHLWLSRTTVPMLTHLLNVALTSVTDGDAELAAPTVDALRVVSGHPRTTAALRARAYNGLRAHGATIGGEDAAKALKLLERNRSASLMERPWRQVTEAANHDADMVAELAAELTEHLRADPAAWLLLDKLGPDHEGTVHDLTLIASAVAAPPHVTPTDDAP